MNYTVQDSKTCELLIRYCRTYPDLQIQDVFKLLYQSSFGCEHLVSSEEKAVEYIKEEFSNTVTTDNPHIEWLDGDYSRVNLSYLNIGLSAQTLGRLFVLSARTEADGKARLIKKLEIAKELIKENKLPFSLADFEREAANWEADGYPAIRHSEAYRVKYAPSYRVIANRYIPFLPLFTEVDKRLTKGCVRIAVEGPSASGKTTLGAMLEEIYGCTVFHTDDFFLRPEQRTPERYAQVGGNIDRERFLEEVLLPMSNGEVVNYSRFDCSEMKLQPAVRINPERLTVIEGAYSMHPEFAKYYNLSVFLDISSDLQKERILKRNSPEKAQRFFNEWIPLEKVYFSDTNAKERCELCIAIHSDS